MRHEKLLTGWYRVCIDAHFSNIKRDRSTGKWTADIRRNDRTLVQYAGIWNTMREAVDEATFILESKK